MAIKSKAKTKNIPDNIIPVDAMTQYLENMNRYSLYVWFERFVPNIADGLKPVQRRLLYCMYNDVKCVSLATKRKSTNTIGAVIASYHAHSPDAAYGAAKCMTNWFECKIPLINYDSLSGSIQGGPQAASRYTESYLSEFTMDVLLGDLKESRSVVDWSKTFDNHTIEPNYLPVKVPLLLVIGTFGISIGERVEIPPHSLNDVIDATIEVMHNPMAKVVLIPDPCQKCELIDTDWAKISELGYGSFTERGILQTVEENGNVYISMRSTPDLIFANSILEKVEELIKGNKLTQIADIQDHSTDNQLDIRFILKRGSDPEYVKQILYKHTPLQDTKRVNMQVIYQDGPMVDVDRVTYKEYITNFLKMRREVKFRLYTSKLRQFNTRLHTIEIYIKILENNDVEKIIHAIRNQNKDEEGKLIEWLMNKLNITDVQAKFILDTQIKHLSKSNLNRFKNEQVELRKHIDECTKIITTPEMIDNEIEQELLSIKAKYGKPRQSIVLPKESITNVASGTFQISAYQNGLIRKSIVGEAFKIIKGNIPHCVCIGDNAKDILIFDEMGKCFKLLIDKIPLFDPRVNGAIDIRTLLKKATSNIVTMVYLPMIESMMNKRSECYCIITTKGGYIKRIDLDDLITATNSGIIYSRLNPSDSVADVIIINNINDILIYTGSKVLRTNINNIPYLKRSTIGNIGIKSNEPVKGLCALTKDTTDIIASSNFGNIIKINKDVFPSTVTNRAGSKIMKLSKNEFITGICACNNNDVIRFIHSDNTFTDIRSIDLIATNDPSNYSLSLNKDIIRIATLVH